jgi:hypothetical protein
MREKYKHRKDNNGIAKWPSLPAFAVMHLH